MGGFLVEKGLIKIEENKAPCQKSYPRVWFNRIAFADNSICDPCVHRFHSLQQQLKDIPSNTSVKLAFSFEISSKDWDIEDLNFNGHEKVELLVNELRNYFGDMCFYYILNHSKIKILNKGDKKWERIKKKPKK